MRWPTRCWVVAAPTGMLQLDEMRLSDQDLRDIDKIIIIAAGTSFYAGMVAKYAIEHWCRIPVEVELAQRVPLPRPDPDHRHPRGRDQPVRRDRRHAAGDPARSRAAIEGPRDLQHQRLDDPARVRRRHLHARRSRDRRRVDQGLPDPARRLLSPGPLPRAGQGHPLRRRDRPGDGPARRDAGAHRDRARQGRRDLRPGADPRRHQVGALPRAPCGLPRRPRRCAQAQGARLHPRRGVRGR